MNNDNSATYGMVALALAVFLSLVALFASSAAMRDVARERACLSIIVVSLSFS